MNDQPLTIQQVAEITGLSEHTLRYYEKIGLIHPINRADNGHRRYSPDDTGWIDFLNKLRATGMLELLKEHRAEVEAHLDCLYDYLKIIRSKIDYYQEVVSEQMSEVS
jgi:DNA-binding transcriptional MerR regulator